MHKVHFYYDVVSPYSWLAFEVFMRFEKTWNVELDLCPFYLGGVMQATGNKAPSLLPARAPYMLQDLMRQSEYFQIPIQIPDSFPSNTITAMRLLTAVKLEHPQQLKTLSRALWQRHYGQGLEITSPESLMTACIQSGFETPLAHHLLEQTQNQDIKDLLKTTTAEAVDKGAFGAPTMFIETKSGEEMFFGSDRFHLIAALFGKKWDGPLL
jgi:glutathione S-transferase kappa 1